MGYCAHGAVCGVRGTRVQVRHWITVVIERGMSIDPGVDARIFVYNRMTAAL